MAALLFSFIAGLLTTLNPCVLPILPIVLASSLQPGKWGPLWLGSGLALGFAVVGTAFAATGQAFGIEASSVRIFSAWLFIIFALVLLVPAFSRRFSALLQPFADRSAAASQAADGGSERGQFLIGLMLGAVWSPCSGPTLGAAIALAASADGYGAAALRMAIFGLGAASVLAVLAFGARQAVLNRRNRMMALANIAKPVMGAALMLIGVLILTGLDHRLEATLTELMPDALVRFTSSI